MAHRKNVSNELILQVARQAELTWVYGVFMATSGVLAAVALVTNSVPVLIGAMVVAPVFPPLGLVAFGLVGGQFRLALQGAGTALLGIGLAVGFAMLTTWMVEALGMLEAASTLMSRPLLEERVRPGWYSVLVAVAAGATGTLALVKKKVDTLVGTVSSVALIPAGAAAGIALLAGDNLRALGGLLLLTINVILIVAMGILVLTLTRPGHDEGKTPPTGGSGL